MKDNKNKIKISKSKSNLYKLGTIYVKPRRSNSLSQYKKFSIQSFKNSILPCKSNEKELNSEKNVFFKYKMILYNHEYICIEILDDIDLNMKCYICNHITHYNCINDYSKKKNIETKFNTCIRGKIYTYIPYTVFKKLCDKYKPGVMKSVKLCENNYI